VEKPPCLWKAIGATSEGSIKSLKLHGVARGYQILATLKIFTGLAKDFCASRHFRPFRSPLFHVEQFALIGSPKCSTWSTFLPRFPGTCLPSRPHRTALSLECSTWSNAAIDTRTGHRSDRSAIARLGPKLSLAAGARGNRGAIVPRGAFFF
jgi:hypothetical protein